MQSYCEAGLPTLLVYKGGDLITSAVRVTDVLSSEITEREVANLLKVKGILKTPIGVDVYKSINDENSTTVETEQNENKPKFKVFGVVDSESEND